MYKGEPNDTLFAFKSFLINKVPVLLTTLSVNMFPPLTPEFCITQALLHVDSNAFPSFSQTFGMSGNTALSDVRQEFLFACTAHGLIQEQSIERLLGEQPMATPPKGGSRYVKENLIMQCSANPGKVEQLLNELENLDCNAGATVGAVVEVRLTQLNRTVCWLTILPGHSESVSLKGDLRLEDDLQCTVPETTIP